MTLKEKILNLNGTMEVFIQTENMKLIGGLISLEQCKINVERQRDDNANRILSAVWAEIETEYNYINKLAVYDTRGVSDFMDRLKTLLTGKEPK